MCVVYAIFYARSTAVVIGEQNWKIHRNSRKNYRCIDKGTLYKEKK